MDGLIACVDPVPGFTGRNGKAIVSMDRYWSGDVPLIRSAHEQGGRTAAEVFLRDGCRKVIQFYGGLDRKKAPISVMKSWNRSYVKTAVRSYP